MKNLTRNEAFMLLFEGSGCLSGKEINVALGKVRYNGQWTHLGKYKISMEKGKYKVEKVK